MAAAFVTEMAMSPAYRARRSEWFAAALAVTEADIAAGVPFR
jgi:hypothetical protein